MLSQFKQYSLLLFLAIILSAINISCRSRTNTPDEYANAYKALMIDCRDRATQIMSSPLPPKSAAKDVNRAAVIKQVEDVSSVYSEFAGKLAALKPPPIFQEVHTTTYAWLKGSAAGNHKWAEAIRHGTRAARDRVSQENDVNEVRALTNMQTALKRAGGSSSKLDAELQEIQDDVKKK